MVTRSDVGEGREESTAFGRAARSLNVRDDWGLPESSSGVPSLEAGRSSGVWRLRFRKFMTTSSSSTDGVFRFRRRREPSVTSPSEAGVFALVKRASTVVTISVDSIAIASDIWVSAMAAVVSLAFGVGMSSRGSSSSAAAHSGHFHSEVAVDAGMVSKQPGTKQGGDVAYNLLAASHFPLGHIVGGLCIVLAA